MKGYAISDCKCIDGISDRYQDIVKLSFCDAAIVHRNLLGYGTVGGHQNRSRYENLIMENTRYTSIFLLPGSTCRWYYFWILVAFHYYCIFR